MSIIRAWKRNKLNLEALGYIGLFVFVWTVPWIYTGLVVLHWFGVTDNPDKEILIMVLLVMIWLELRVPRFMKEHGLAQ